MSKSLRESLVDSNDQRQAHTQCSSETTVDQDYYLLLCDAVAGSFQDGIKCEYHNSSDSDHEEPKYKHADPIPASDSRFLDHLGTHHCTSDYEYQSLAVVLDK